MLKALSEGEIIFAVRQWISTLLQQRKVCVRVGDLLLYVITKYGLPQGGGLSPLLWSLVADSLLKWLSKHGVFAQGFADDGVIIIVGKVLYILSDIMQRMLRGVEKWCADRHLSVNPSKTETILFTRKYKPEIIRPIILLWKRIGAVHSGKIPWGHS